MGWILIAVSLILLWIASSWKVLYSSSSSYAKTSFFSDGWWKHMVFIC
jgi:N-acetylglucosaminylphosphatidylinositol deacetylase